jgi:signal transduction histidine kinase
MKSIKSVLLVEDNAGDARLLREMFSENDSHDSELNHVACMKDAEKYLAEHSVDLILLDLGLPDADGLGAIRRIRAAAPRTPLVVLTGLDDDTMAVQALHEGAQDFLIKGQIDTRGLLRAMRYANERKRLEGMKDEFVSSVSHELRTPLTSISGSLGLLMANAAGTLPETAMRLLKIAHANSQRLVRLVNDILDIEKMESGRVVFNLEKIEVRAMVARAIEANRGFAESHDVRIKLQEESGLCDVRADGDRLAQVLTNLLSNAIKFSPVKGEVVVAVKSEHNKIRITVRDHGAGISSEFKAHIFERFAQADASNARKRGGTGLGLSIVKQIVDRLDGEVGFEDAPGGGTIFYVDLPCWKTESDIAIVLDAPAGALRILICEDDLDAAVVLREQLKQVGFVTDIAHTSADAITCAMATQYRAVLVDLQLPDGDGITLILRLREMPQYADTPIVVVSADPARGRNDERSSRLNVLGWLNKPLNMDQLVRMLGSSQANATTAAPRAVQKIA